MSYVLYFLLLTVNGFEPVTDKIDQDHRIIRSKQTFESIEDCTAAMNMAGPQFASRADVVMGKCVPVKES